MRKKTIVITGCSGGFGRLTALTLIQRNWHVFATLTEKVARRASETGFSSLVDTVVQALSSRRPRIRYIVPCSAGRQVLLRRFLPDSIWDRLLRRTLKW